MIFLTYDANVRAAYIGVSKARVEQQEELLDGRVIVDRSADGELVGLEVLGTLDPAERKAVAEQVGLDGLAAELLGRYDGIAVRVPAGAELALA